VLSVTGMETRRTCNVIPDTVRLFGTVRAYAPEIMAVVRDRMESLPSQVASGHACTAVLDFW